MACSKVGEPVTRSHQLCSEGRYRVVVAILLNFLVFEGINDVSILQILWYATIIFAR